MGGFCFCGKSKIKKPMLITTHFVSAKVQPILTSEKGTVETAPVIEN
jgi:hypothetical protein